MLSKGWIVKVRHYRGGESVLTVPTPEKEDAQRIADSLNEDYQTDIYYIEEWVNPFDEYGRRN